MIYALPIAKSNWPEGRVGPTKMQDSYIILKVAADLARKNIVDKLLIFSAFKTKNVKKIELDCMIEACKEEKVPEEKMIVRSVGYDTVSVIKFSIDFCKEQEADLLIVSSQFHYPRIRWIAWRLNKKGVVMRYKIVFGIPRPQEMITDVALIFLYPIIDLLGYAEWFTKHMHVRRDKGYLV